MRGAKRHDPMTQRVIDRENERLSSDDHGNATELVPIEKLEALVFGDFFKIGFQFRFIHGVPSHSSHEAHRPWRSRRTICTFLCCVMRWRDPASRAAVQHEYVDGAALDLRSGVPALP